jgi:general secretion pathway protein N
MRFAEAAPRTWLLATLAGWALCVWLLSLSGMGGSIERLAEDPSLLRPLPGAFQPAPERLGPLQQYAEPASRPLFTDNRRPQPFLIDPMAEAGDGSGSFDFVLTSVLRTPTLEMVILQPSGGGRSLGVKLGESPEGLPAWSLASITGRSAVFNGPDGELRLELRQFDGVGGEPPTRMSAVPPPPGAPAADGPAGAGGSGNGAMVVPTPVAVGTPGAGPDMPVGGPGAAASDAPGAATAGRTPPDQVEAIRKRIEERRARLRQQDQQNEQTP